MLRALSTVEELLELEQREDDDQADQDQPDLASLEPASSAGAAAGARRAPSCGSSAVRSRRCVIASSSSWNVSAPVIADTTSSIVTSLGPQPRDALAEPQHLDAVGDLEDLGHVVADQHDREARVAHAPDQVEHVARLHDAERGGRLVHEDDLARPRDGAAIATPWRWPPDMLATGALGVLDAARRGRGTPRRCAGASRALSRKPSLPSSPGAQDLAAEEHVRRRVELGRQREVLVDGLDPELARRVRRRGSTTGLPSKRISPLSGGCTPTSVLTSVLLPAPLSPTSATTSCG